MKWFLLFRLLTRGLRDYENKKNGVETVDQGGFFYGLFIVIICLAIQFFVLYGFCCLMT